MFKKLFSHTAIYGLAPQVVRLAQLLVLPIITPFLTAEDYGTFGVISAVMGAVGVFSTLGLNIVVANSFLKSSNQYKWLWRQIYGFLILWNFVFAGILGIVIYFFIPEEAKANTATILLLNIIPTVLFAPAAMLGNMYYQLAQKPMQIAIRSVIIGLIAVFLNIYLMKELRLGYMGWFWGGAVTQVILQFSYYFPLKKLGIMPIYNFKWKTIKKQIKICLPTIPHFYSGYLLGSFDRVIMKFYNVNIDQIGLFNAAQTPARLYESAASAVNQAVSPLLQQAYKDNQRKDEQKLNFTIIIIFLTITSISCLFSKELIPLLIKSKGMEDIYKLAIVLIMAYNYRPMYVAANNKLFYVEKTEALLKVTTVAAILSVFLNGFFIYFMGVKGATYAMFISLMYMGYSGFFIKEFKEAEGTEHHPLFWLTLTVLLSVGVYFAVELNIWVKGVIALVLAVCGLLGFFSINKGK